jgi:hypothetical protein
MASRERKTLNEMVNSTHPAIPTRVRQASDVKSVDTR